MHTTWYILLMGPMLMAISLLRSIILSTVAEKLLNVGGGDGDITTLSLIHDSLEARMTLLKTIKVGLHCYSPVLG